MMIGTSLPENHIFVFGSNIAGRHGKGAALHAKRYFGAKESQGEGLMGQSYGIPTKDGRSRGTLSNPKETLRLTEIRSYVNTFITFAESRPDLTFRVTAIGCGLAGFKPEQIAPMFNSAPNNCILPKEFE